MKVLYIDFNEFYPDEPLTYTVCWLDNDDRTLVKELKLKQKPKGRYNEVWECGNGPLSAKQVRGHPLEKKQSNATP